MSTINSIHHINFVVRELAPHVEYLRTLLQSEPIIEDLPTRKVKTARFCLSGIWIVLVQPTSKEGEVARILAKHIVATKEIEQKLPHGLFTVTLRIQIPRGSLL